MPGLVYALSGFEFTEYYFVVSDDGRQLIGIDAGTRADSAKVAYEALRAYAPSLPELTTIFIHRTRTGITLAATDFPRSQSALAVLCPEQLSGRNCSRSRCSENFWQAILR